MTFKLQLREDRPATIQEHRALRDEIKKLRHPFRSVDDLDWQHLNMMLPESGHGRFWKAVLAELRVALGE